MRSLISYDTDSQVVRSTEAGSAVTSAGGDADSQEARSTGAGRAVTSTELLAEISLCWIDLVPGVVEQLVALEVASSSRLTMECWWALTGVGSSKECSLDTVCVYV